MNEKSEYYFAYGSNLYFKQIKERCPSSTFYSKAVKQHYQICFPIISVKRNNSAVASMRKQKGSYVEGVIYKLSGYDLIKLDRYEALGTRYERKIISVELENGRRKKVWTYFAKANHKEDLTPAGEYLDLILRGSIEHNLSEKYITLLTKHSF